MSFDRVAALGGLTFAFLIVVTSAASRLGVPHLVRGPTRRLPRSVRRKISPVGWIAAARLLDIRREGDTVRVESKEHTELIQLVRAWDEAMVSNDTEAIGSFMSDDCSAVVDERAQWVKARPVSYAWPPPALSPSAR